MSLVAYQNQNNYSIKLTCPFVFQVIRMQENIMSSSQAKQKCLPTCLLFREAADCSCTLNYCAISITQRMCLFFLQLYVNRGHVHVQFILSSLLCEAVSRVQCPSEHLLTVVASQMMTFTEPFSLFNIALWTLSMLTTSSI